MKSIEALKKQQVPEVADQGWSKMEMVEIFNEVKRLCRGELLPKTERKESPLKRLKSISVSLASYVNKAYTCQSTQFVGALCILTFIEKSKASCQKISSLLKSQFYQNLPLVLVDAYQSSQDSLSMSEAKQNGNTWSTLMRLLAQLHESRTRLQKKVFTPKMLSVLSQFKPPCISIYLFQYIKLVLQALRFSNVEQRYNLILSISRIFESPNCHLLIAERALLSIQSYSSVTALPKSRLQIILVFLKQRLSQAVKMAVLPRGLLTFYAKYSRFCPQACLRPTDLPQLAKIYKQADKTQKNWVILLGKTIEFEQGEDQRILLSGLTSESGIQASLYLELLLHAIPNLDSGCILQLFQYGLFTQLDSLVQGPQKGNFQLTLRLLAFLYKKVADVSGEIEWAIRQKIKLLAGQGFPNVESEAEKQQLQIQ